MLYTSEQLLQLHNSPQSGWIMVRNDDIPNPLADVSNIVLAGGAVESDGVWKLHVSIAPEDMVKAIPIIHAYFCHPSTPAMGMKLASKALLAEAHQSGKEIALIFDRATERSLLGRRKILLFLSLLAIKLEAAGVKPEAKPPLTVETEEKVRVYGSEPDKNNLERGKYDATIKLRENEELSYFNYRDEMALLFDDDVYVDMVRFAASPERPRMIKRSEFNQYDAQYKHNPLKRSDDFLYNVVLERHITFPNGEAVLEPVAQANLTLIIRANSKEQFLNALEAKIRTQALTRANILDLFSEIKQQDGSYAYIHQQRNLKWDRVRLFFKSTVLGQDENNFWHTATYQKAVKLLKDAYVARGPSDQSDIDRSLEANAFIDYVRGNSPIHFRETSTRSLLN